MLQFDPLRNNNSPYDRAQELTEQIIDLSYRGSKVQRKLLILINPHGGQGNAFKIYENSCAPIFVAAKTNIRICETQYHHHAYDIASELDINSYDVVACASGDGIPHEVLNGFFNRQDAKEALNTPIVQLPCGSGNAFSVSCVGSTSPSLSALASIKGIATKVDLMALTQGTGSHKRTSLSFLSQTYGLIADCDIGTENMRWLGPARFDLGVLHRRLIRTKYPCDIFIKYSAKSKLEVRKTYEAHSNKRQDLNELDSDQASDGLEYDSKSKRTQEEVREYSSSDLLESESDHPKYMLGNFPSLEEPVASDWEQLETSFTRNIAIFYVGKMPYMAPDTLFFPACLPDDGAMDLVMMDSRVSFLDSLKILTNIDKGSPFSEPQVHYSKITAYRLIPKVDSGYISVDGESFPFEPFQVEVIPKLGTFIMKNGTFIEGIF